MSPVCLLCLALHFLSMLVGLQRELGTEPESLFFQLFVIVITDTDTV